MRKKLLPVFLGILSIIGFGSCSNFEGNQEIPSYIKIDAINLVQNNNIPQSSIEGFNTSLITDVWIYVDNINIGAFTLPCEIPILEEGSHKIDIRPGVKLNGIAMTRAEYPFYSYYSQTHNLIPGKTIDFGTLEVKYNDILTKFSLVELFESPSIEFTTDGINPDSTNLITKINHIDSVEYGSYCGAMYLGKNQASYKIITDSMYVTNKDVLILELDYWCNIPFDIGIKGKTSSGSKDYYINAMRVNANSNKGWQKIYVVMGKVWQQLYYPNTFRVFLSPANPNNIDNGWVYIDNVKLIHKPNF